MMMKDKELIELGEVAFYKFKHSAGTGYKGFSEILISHIERMGYQVTKKSEPCEVFHGGEWHKCIRLGFDMHGNHAYQITHGEFTGEFNGTRNESEFRKARTEEEKLLDEALEKALHVYSEPEKEVEQFYKDKIKALNDLYLKMNELTMKSSDGNAIIYAAPISVLAMQIAKVSAEPFNQGE